MRLILAALLVFNQFPFGSIASAEDVVPDQYKKYGAEWNQFSPFEKKFLDAIDSAQFKAELEGALAAPEKKQELLDRWRAVTRDGVAEYLNDENSILRKPQSAANKIVPSLRFSKFEVNLVSAYGLFDPGFRDDYETRRGKAEAALRAGQEDSADLQANFLGYYRGLFKKDGSQYLAEFPPQKGEPLTSADTTGLWAKLSPQERALAGISPAPGALAQIAVKYAALKGALGSDLADAATQQTAVNSAYADIQKIMKGYAQTLLADPGAPRDPAGAPDQRFSADEWQLLTTFINELPDSSQKKFTSDYQAASDKFKGGDKDAAGNFAAKWRGWLKASFDDYARNGPPRFAGTKERAEYYDRQLGMVQNASDINSILDQLFTQAAPTTNNESTVDATDPLGQAPPITTPPRPGAGASIDKTTVPNITADKEKVDEKKKANPAMKSVPQNAAIGGILGLLLGLALSPVMGPWAIVLGPLAGAALVGGSRYASNKWGG